MTRLDEHPSVVRHRERTKSAAPGVLDADWLRQVCLEAGADDVGFVAIDRAEVEDQRAEIHSAFPATRTLVSFVRRLNPEPIRSPARSVANQEFHVNYEHVNEVARRVVMNGFTDWVSTIADSRDGKDYRRRAPANESASMWQSLSFKANYKAAYCVAVCPAGEDVIGPFLDDRRSFLEGVVDPLKNKAEPVYVIPGSDAEAHVARRFPRKTIRRVRGLRGSTIRGLLFGMKLTFQREASRGLSATYHLTITGREPAEATVVIQDRTLTVEDGLVGEAQVRVVADRDAWLGVLAGERSLIWAPIWSKIRLRGPLRLLAAFGRCFPN